MNTSDKSVRIATRRSKLALVQSNWVKSQLEARRPDVSVVLVEIVTSGDRIQDRALREVGGKSLFVKEIEEALLDGRADIAVHSLKDLPSELPPGLTLLAVPPREDARDALIGRTPLRSISDLPEGAFVGTASLRRQALLRLHRPDLRISMLRGNVDTRLRKLHEGGELDAILLAEAGLRRLGLVDVDRLPLDLATFVPAACQGILGIEAGEGRDDLGWVVELFEHAPTRLAAEAERAYLGRVEGSCRVPVGAYAREEDGGFLVTGIIGDESGDVIMRSVGPVEVTSPSHAGALGDELARRVLLAGGATIALQYAGDLSGAGRVVVPEGQKPLTDKRVLVTRSRQQASKLSKLLSQAGAKSIELPSIEIRAVEGDEKVALHAALSRAGSYDWVVFTSANGVRCALEALTDLGLDSSQFADTKIAAIGATTSTALSEADLLPSIVPNEFQAEGLLEAMSAHVTAATSVLVLRAREARSVLPKGLRELGAKVDDVPTYFSQPPADLVDQLRQVFTQPVDVMTFASSKTVRHLATAAGDQIESLRKIPVACIGPVTRRTAREYGFDVVVQPETFDIPALVEGIVQWAALNAAE